MDLIKMTEYLDSLIARGIPSVDCVIYREHEMIYRHMKGTIDDRQMEAIQGDEFFLMFSMTKVHTMTAVMQLVEKGELSLEDEVSKYLPAYSNLTVERNGKIESLTTPLKVKHLLSMQSGLDYDLDRPGIKRVLKEKGTSATTREIIDAFTESPLRFAPGEHYLYSLSHDVAAAIVEVISDMSFGDYLRKHIWEPLHMKKTFFAKPINHLKKLAVQYTCNEQGEIVPMESSCNYQLSENYESGGAGLISCTEDYAIFADALASGGISKDGHRLLKQETIELMKQNLLSETSLQDFSNRGYTGYGYGCGIQVLMDPDRLNSPAPEGIFGWSGAAGSYVIMDTKSKLSLVYIQHVRKLHFAYAEIHPRLRDLLYE